MADVVHTSAIILAGGHSSRLGRDKASERVMGRSLLQHVYGRVASVVDEVVIVRRRAQELSLAEGNAVVVEDGYPEAGPLGGLFTGLSAVRAPLALAVATDMPLVETALLSELLRLAADHNAVVPRADDRVQPLCAAYAKTCAATLEALLLAGERRLTVAVDALRPMYLEPKQWRRLDPEGLSFLNVNTEDDLERVRSRLA